MMAAVKTQRDRRYPLVSVGGFGREREPSVQPTRTSHHYKGRSRVALSQRCLMAGVGCQDLARSPLRGDNTTVTTLVVSLLMIGNAGAMLAAGIGIGRRRRLNYGFAFLVLAVNIVLTLTDQFGLLDVVTLVIDLILLGLLIGLMKQTRPARLRAD